MAGRRLFGCEDSEKVRDFANPDVSLHPDIHSIETFNRTCVIPPFFFDITRYKSLSVVGMAKNVGKTVCLRALLGCYRSPEKASALAVTSIGMDGENTDTLFKTAKPELDFYPGMLVQTSEQHYFRRHLSADILDVSRETTACGRLVTARVLTPGKLILSGYAYTGGLRHYIAQAHAFGAKTAVVDGALSRMSLASPFVSEAMILCTGAALSKNLNELVQKTRLQYSLMELPVLRMEPGGEELADSLSEIRSGVYGIGPDGEIKNLDIPSLLQIDKHLDKIGPYCRPGCRLYISGLLGDSFLKFLSSRRHRPDLVVSDFTKLFVGMQAFQAFIRSGSRIWVLQQPKILGVCVNPSSPDGYVLDSLQLRERMGEALGREVYDILA